MLIETLQNWAQAAADQICDLRQYPTPPHGSPPGIVAHRGAWDGATRENTMAAFERARELGAWAIEFDVHFTKDGVAVVNHDPDLHRGHGLSNKISAITFKDLRAAAPAVPALDEVLQLRGLHLMLEVKALDSEQAAILAHQLRGREPLRDFHLLTLRPDLVRASSAMPEPAWILVGDVNMRWLTTLSLERGLGGVAGHYLFLTEKLIERLHAKGQRAGVGFTPNRNLFHREWSRGVDWVFTNHLAGVIGER